MKIVFAIVLSCILISEIGFCETMSKEEEVYAKELAFGLSNVWRQHGNGFKILGALEGPSSWIDQPIIIFELYIEKPYPPKADTSFEINTFALVSIGPKTGLCKFQLYSINPSRVESFSCDGNHINFKWGCYDVAIVKGEQLCNGEYKCHILFTEQFFDSISKNWIEKKWKSVDGIKLGEVILR